MRFRFCIDLDDISLYFSDPVVIASLLLSKKANTIPISGTLKNILHKLYEHVTTIDEQYISYVRLQYENKTLRMLLIKDIIIAIFIEERDIVHIGAKSIPEFLSIFNSDKYAKLILDIIPLESINDILSNKAKECSKRAFLVPIQLWKSTGLYGYTIKDIISDKDPFTYIIKAVDRYGRTYMLKVVKDSIAVKNNVFKILRGYGEIFKVMSITIDRLRKILEKYGYDVSLANILYTYTRYIAPIRAIIIPIETYDERTYIDLPPTIVEDYADLGDMEKYVLEKKPDLAEILYIVEKIVGALAIAHIMGVGHFNIEPKNILLFKNNNEPYGYIPKIDGFRGDEQVLTWYEEGGVNIGFSDPIALMKNTVDYSYDVYSLGMVLIYGVQLEVPRHRLLLNNIILKELYGYSIPIDDILTNDENLIPFAKDITTIILKLKESEINIEKAITNINNLVAELDNKYVNLLNTNIGIEIKNFIRKSISLNPLERFRNCLDMYVSLMRTIHSDHL